MIVKTKVTNFLSKLAGAPIVWKFIREEWPYLVNRFSLNDRYLGRLPQIVTADFSSQFQLQETNDFFNKYPEAGAGIARCIIICMLGLNER
jgi:glutamyl aminopeptidase